MHAGARARTVHRFQFMNTNRLRLHAIFALLGAALALCLAACHSGPPRGAREPMVIPRMAAAGNFFEERLEATIDFDRARVPHRPGTPVDADGGPRRDAKSGARRGGASFSGGAGMGSMNMQGGGARPGGAPPEGSARTRNSGPRPRMENNPAVQLFLTLTNRSAHPMDIEVLELNSALGNFAVSPAKVSLAPGQSAAFEPMTSRLGIPQGDLPITLRLRASGITDEQTVMLKRVATADDANVFDAH